MKVVLDEENLIANVTWQYETGVQSFIYGDADRLPTGHVLACYWPQQLSSTMLKQFDARVVEVAPRAAARDASASDAAAAEADEVAWELLVHGHRCDEPPPTGCSRSSQTAAGSHAHRMPTRAPSA